MTTTVQAEAPTSAAGPVPKWPTDWDQVLDTAIRTWRGEWTTNRVQQLYKARYGDSMHRADARAFLSRRAHQGVLRLNNRADARYYTLRTTRGNQS